jgi:hypothetical protein
VPRVVDPALAPEDLRALFGQLRQLRAVVVADGHGGIVAREAAPGDGGRGCDETAMENAAAGARALEALRLEADAECSGGRVETVFRLTAEETFLWIPGRSAGWALHARLGASANLGVAIPTLRHWLERVEK